MTIEERAIVEIEEAFEQLGCRYDGYFNKLIEVTKQALEKQIPKKVIPPEVAWQVEKCPSCGVDIDRGGFWFCEFCGQRLDWGEEK